MFRSLLAIAVMLASHEIAHAQPKKVTVPLEARSLTLSHDLILDADGTIRLARSVLLSHGLGATDYHQTETLDKAKWAKTIFHLDSAEVADAEIFFFGAANDVAVNGKELPKSERLKSTGWSRVKVPTSALQKGDNEIIFKCGGSLLVEPGRPAKSSRSLDGGKTWSQDNLSRTGDQAGEYLVRLRLERYAPRGWALSPVIDLWQEHAGPGKLAVPCEATSINVDRPGPQPEGAKIAVRQRMGDTPTPDDTWTTWKSLGDIKADKRRWVQLRFELTGQAQATPKLPKTITLRSNVEGLMVQGALVELARKEPIRRTFLPFGYQGPSARLDLLRKRHKLDDVIVPGKTEMEQLMLLRYWVRNQWHTGWGNHPQPWMPPWDALIILESKDQPDCLTMCTHYAAVFTQCCQALGWTARHCILDHHCVAEVYVQEYDRWVMMDAGNSAERADVGLHFERKGVPLSARELHLAYKAGPRDDITVHFTPQRLVEKIAPLCRPAPKPPREARPDMAPLADLKKFPVCQLENYRRYAFPARNTFLTSLVPGELYQGWSEYFYDGYWWVGDSPDLPTTSPEYTNHLDPTRPADADWNVNWSRIHLSQKAGPTIQVHLETLTPGFSHFEQREKDAWKKVAATFDWQLTPGRSELTIRSVNHWGRAGTPETVYVTR